MSICVLFIWHSACHGGRTFARAGAANTGIEINSVERDKNRHRLNGYLAQRSPA